MNLQFIKIYLKRNEIFLIKLAIIAAVLLLSAYLGRRGSRMNVVMITGGIAVFVFLRWPFVGLITLLTGALLIPFCFGTGTGEQTDLNIVIILLPVLIGLWFLDMLVIQRSIILRPMRVVLPRMLLCPFSGG